VHDDLANRGSFCVRMFGVGCLRVMLAATA
jgi:hypothetical protein